MSVGGEFLDYITDHLAPLGAVRTRRMFGSAGLFYGDVLFAIINDESIYFRVDEQTVDRFITAGGQPFTYRKAGKPIAIAYYTAPDSILDDADALQEWARLGIEAAARQHRKKAKPARRGNKR